MKGDWYFDGYEGRKSVDSDGKARRKLVYTGEYYGFARGQKPVRFKIAFLSLTLLYYLFFVINALSRSAVSRVIYAGLPMVLSVVPGLYLLIGVCCFLTAGAEMTVRTYYASLRRMLRSLRFIVPLLALSVVGCLVFLARNPALFSQKAEWMYLCLDVLSLAVTAAELWLMRKNPVVVTRDPEPQSRRIKELEEKDRKPSLFRRNRKN